MKKKPIIELRNGPLPKTQEFKKFWNVVNASESDAEIILYGEVCSSHPIDWLTGQAAEGLFITPEGFLEDIEQVKNKQNITVRLNSVGGDLFTGIAIHNVLKGLPANITVIVEGIAASAGSIIMCSGDDVQVYPGSVVMVHGLAYGLCGWFQLQDLQRLVNSGDVCERAIAEIYKAKTGKEIDELRKLMLAEGWMTGSDAIESGFADTLLDGEGPEMSVTNNNQTLIANGIKHDISAYNMPEDFCINQKGHQGIAAMMNGFISQMQSMIQGGDVKNIIPNVQNKAQKTEIQNEEGGTPVATTIEELKNESPELVAQIEKAAKEEATTSAVEAERKRIQEIEKIQASIGDEELINEAKYGESPCTAAELALKALQKQATVGKDHLADINADAAQSGTSKVQATANDGNVDDDEADAQKKVGILDKAFSNSQNGGKK